VYPRKSFWTAWGPVFVWLGVIAIESTGTLSSENTSRFLYPVLHFLFGLDPVRFLTWHFLLRKSGHVIGYGILSWLLFRAWRVSIPLDGRARWSMLWSVLAVAGTGAVAGLDEWHQSFLPSRTGTIRDVLLDSAAALATQFLLFLVLRGWSRNERSQLSSEANAPQPDSEKPSPYSQVGD
jgi:VanZ family protein